jgi:hypothetical protein
VKITDHLLPHAMYATTGASGLDEPVKFRAGGPRDGVGRALPGRMHVHWLGGIQTAISDDVNVFWYAHIAQTIS